MTFETWCEEFHNIDHMGFTLRSNEEQKRIIAEYNRYNRVFIMSKEK